MSRSTTRTLVALAVVVLVALGRGTPALQAETTDPVVMVVHPRNPKKDVTGDDVKKIFLGQTAFWNGVVPIKLLVRPDGDAATKSFLAKPMDMTAQAFHTHWDKLQLSGRAIAPTAVGTVDDMLGKVKATPGAIGFALASEVKDAAGVKVLSIR